MAAKEKLKQREDKHARGNGRGRRDFSGGSGGGNSGADDFAIPLLSWFERHGRKDLPWQQHPSKKDAPYRVWVSEIMLQQTQVATVIPYFNAFMQCFPSIAALAAAPVDEVLHHWSGLGYYARARNLQRAAQQIMSEYDGEFPRTLDTVMALPGIGRSTAGAILALACGQRHPILDGNVKRVLARYFAVAGFPGTPAVAERLWAFAEKCLPTERVDEYTQAMMDLGATVCLRSRPLCNVCPVAAGCVARATHKQNDFPAPKPRKAKPLKRTCMLLAVRAGGLVLLERRPPAGIWGGLWGLPEFTSSEAARDWCVEKFSLSNLQPRSRPVLRHSFTHFDLDIEPLLIDCKDAKGRRVKIEEEGKWLWYNTRAPARLGLAAPVKTLIESIGQLPLFETRG